VRSIPRGEGAQVVVPRHLNDKVNRLAAEGYTRRSIITTALEEYFERNPPPEDVDEIDDREPVVGKGPTLTASQKQIRDARGGS
jgi:hypothetical protein